MKHILRVLLASLITTVALAQQPAAAPQSDQLPATIAPLDENQTRLFERFDRDGDGMISQEEYRNQVVRYFKRMDARSRGYVDENDVRKADPGELRNRPNDPADKISLEDFQKQSFRDFEKADANHDGKLSPEEFKTWLEIVKARRDQAGNK